jgi:hypothetical protein
MSSLLVVTALISGAFSTDYAPCHTADHPKPNALHKLEHTNVISIQYMGGKVNF